MKTNIFHLQIIPIKSILPHEEFDSRRTKPLVVQLKKEKQLTNPIIVAQFDDEHYLQLDGMNRFSAFRAMGIPTILAQIVDYNDQETVELSSWTHLFYQKTESLLKCTWELNKFLVKKGEIDDVGHRYIKNEGMGRLCTIVTKKGEVYLISTGGDLPEKVEKLNKLVTCYKENIFRDVLPSVPNKSTIEFLFREHPETNMMLVFPTFTRHQIIEVVKKGGLFPPGVTRHLIKRRCLNVNLPLALFKSQSLEKQNKKLEEILTKRLFRVYEESTIYFE